MALVTAGWDFIRKGYRMSPKLKCLALASALLSGYAFAPAAAAEREQVRAVVNLIAAVKMPFPEKLRSNLSRTERVDLDTNSATIACLRLDDKQIWCYEHIAAVGARAEMLRISSEPVAGLVANQTYNYVVDYDLDGLADVGSTTKIEGQPQAPVGTVAQFFHRSAGRGDQFRGEYQKLLDDGVQIALKYLGE
jgi:hypothetical protein